MRAEALITRLRLDQGRTRQAAAEYEALLARMDDEYPKARERWVWRLLHAQALERLGQVERAQARRAEAEALREAAGR